jgi:hypothetical protein
MIYFLQEKKFLSKTGTQYRPALYRSISACGVPQASFRQKFLFLQKIYHSTQFFTLIPNIIAVLNDFEKIYNKTQKTSKKPGFLQ